MSRTAGISRTVSLGALLVVIIIAAGAYAFIYPGSYLAGAKSSSTTTNLGSQVNSSSLSSLSPLITFNADSYNAEVQALLQGFSNSTGVPVAPTHSAGSNALASQIASGSQDDVFVPVALSATAPSHLKNFSAGWAIGFASDQMVIAYSNASEQAPAAAQVVSEYQQASRSNATSDWGTLFASLTSGGVKLGIADPNADPAGLRGWLVLEGAGRLYAGGNTSAYTAPLLRSGGNVTGAAAATMVAPLEAGQLQFLFVYRSLAISQHLGYFRLDHRINLGDPSLAASYAQLTYQLATGPAKGGPIILCITIPSDAPHAAEAAQFVQYVAKNSGSALSGFGLRVFAPPLLYNNTAPPQLVSTLLSEGIVARGGSLGQ